jgi:hypothetical protein
MSYFRRLVVDFPSQVLWDLLWTKWQWAWFSPSISISPANAHSTTCSTFINHSIADSMPKEYFYYVDRVHGSALHGGRCAACREAHTNFADESACLTANNFRNKVITIHRSQEASKLLSSLHLDMLRN